MRRLNLLLKKTYCSILLLLSAVFILAQPKVRPSEVDINVQKIFIEATKEKLLERYEDAAYLFTEVLKQDNKNHAAAYELARMYDVLEKPSKAIQAIKKAIALDQSNIWYKITYGQILKNANRDTEATKVFEALAKEHPDNEYYHYQWAFFLVRSKDPEGAIKIYNMLEQKQGVSEELTKKKHSLFLGLGRTKKAAEEIQNLIRTYPKEIKYHLMLAEHYKETGEDSKAGGVYEDILKIEPDNPEANLALADGFQEKGDDVRYLNSIKPIFKKPEVEIDIKIKKLLPYVKKFATQPKEEIDDDLAVQALELGEILATVHPQEAKAHSIYADILLNTTNESKKALDAYYRTKKLNNTVFSVWEQIMYINAELGNYDELLKVSEEALDLFPNQAKAYYLNGIALNQKERSKDAINSYEQSLMMAGKNYDLKFDIYYRLGIAYFDAKAFEKSDRAFEEALKINPESAKALGRYSFHLAERGVQLSKAKEMAEKAKAKAPNQPMILDTYSWVLYKLKDYIAAEQWGLKALQAGGENISVILEHYGDILFQSGEKQQALQYWKKAKTKGGKSTALDRKISQQKL